MRRSERVLLGLRLDEPLALGAGVDRAVDWSAVERLERLGLVESGGSADGTLALTTRGRFLGGGVTAELLA